MRILIDTNVLLWSVRSTSRSYCRCSSSHKVPSFAFSACALTNSSYFGTNAVVSCVEFAALNNGEVVAGSTKTRGAYNVLLDLVTALGGDLAPTVKYTLLIEEDLDVAPALRQGLADARARVVPLLG